MIPDPTPVDGIDRRPRDETPSDVIVTTESRTAATMSVRAGSVVEEVLLEPVAVVTPPGAVEAAGVAARFEVASGPVTNAAVPPAARTADRSDAASTDAIRPPPRPRRGSRSGADPWASGARWPARSPS